MLYYVIPDAWAHRAEREEKKNRKWFGHSFAGLCDTIMVCSKWGGLSGIKLWPQLENFGGEKLVPLAGF